MVVLPEVPEEPEVPEMLDAEQPRFFRIRLPNDYFEDEVSEPDTRSIELLKSWLTPQQLADFEDFDCFDVIGGETGQRYRLKRGTNHNIKLGKGAAICVAPAGVGSLVGDVLLAQKIGLERNERATLAVAFANVLARTWLADTKVKLGMEDQPPPPSEALAVAVALRAASAQHLARVGMRLLFGRAATSR
jgi:hypothetical protein